MSSRRLIDFEKDIPDLVEMRVYLKFVSRLIPMRIIKFNKQSRFNYGD